MQPVIIIGDFNAEPNSLKGAEELMDEEGWIDAGAVASWWGGVDNMPTCSQRAEARETRIDGALVNSTAIPLIKSFTVVKDTMIPTHSVVQLHLNLDVTEEPRTYIKTFPSLKSLLDAKITGETEGIEDHKDKAAKVKQMKQDMKGIIARLWKRHGCST